MTLMGRARLLRIYIKYLISTEAYLPGGGCLKSMQCGNPHYADGFSSIIRKSILIVGT